MRRFLRDLPMITSRTLLHAAVSDRERVQVRGVVANAVVGGRVPPRVALSPHRGGQCPCDALGRRSPDQNGTEPATAAGMTSVRQ